MTNFDAHLPPRPAPRNARAASPEHALRHIPDRARIVVPALSGTPTGLLAALDDLRDGWSELELACGNLLAQIAPLDHPGAPFRFSTYQTSGPLRAAEQAGQLEQIPATYAQIPTLFAPDGPLPADAVLLQISPPGPDGRHSLGTSVGGIIDVIRTAPLAIAQVNANIPYTFGAAELAADEFDWLVELDSDIPQLRRAEPGEIELQIAEHVVSLVPDGATLQFGLGGIPEAIMGLLGERRELGVHSGLISDGIIGLHNSGALTGVSAGARKTTAPGLIITTEAAGGAEFYRWLHRNDAVRLAPASYTHSLLVLAQLDNFVAINSAVQVALDGSVNAESVGGRQISGPGGQPDFAAAAQLNGGRSVIAMPSTAARGRVSRIVDRLDADAVVTTPRYLADVVVTEYGIAHLRGRTLTQRTDALRAIAAPKFRPELGTDGVDGG